MKSQKVGGRFKIIKGIGRGSFGKTYLAEDYQKFNSFCVVKELKPMLSEGPEILEMAQTLFYKEAKVLHELSHLHSEIPYLVAYFQENQKFYLVQEFIEGHDLSQEIFSGCKLSELEVILLLEDILKPLSFLHRNKIIHRDIKPTNLMRRRSDKKIVLIDFGAIKELASPEMFDRFGGTKVGTIVGTPGYMPSEQAVGKAKLCSDVYAVGAIGIQALTGLMPQQIEENPNTGELKWQHLVDISYELQAILEKMVRYHFTYRYPTAIEALAEIQKLRQNLLKKERSKVINKSRQKKISRVINKSRSYQSARNTIAEATLLKKNIENTTVAVRSSLGLYSQTKMPRRNIIKIAVLVVTGAFLAFPLKKIFNSSYQSKHINNKKTSQAPAKTEITLEDLKEKNSPKPEKLSVELKTFSCEVITVNEKAEQIDRAIKEIKYFSEDLGNNIVLEMVVIPSGTFKMGAALNEKHAQNIEYPQHQVNIKTFAISKFQITQAQWRAVATLPKIDRDLEIQPSYFKGDRLPVEQISWYDAIEFAARLSQKTGRKYRLPSEAEWEYATRANTQTPFHFGPTISSNLANYDAAYLYAEEPRGKFRDRTLAVGSFFPNAFGLYDTHGNVLEWCADTWLDNYKHTPTDGSPNQKGDINLRVYRGGSWFSDAISCRSANRDKGVPNLKYRTLGVRLACNFN